MTLGIENAPRGAQTSPRRTVLSAIGEPALREHCEYEKPELACTQSGQPVKSGVVYALHGVPGGRQVKVRVVLKVYVSNFGRYAVVSQERAISRDCGFINLKHCTVKILDIKPSSYPKNKYSTTKALYSFQVISRKAEGRTMTFCVTSQSEAEHWVRIMTGSESDSSRQCPTLRKETHVAKRTLSPCRRPVCQLSPLMEDPPKDSGKSKSLLSALEEE